MEETQPGSIGLRLLAVLVLVVANAFFVAAEFALVSARRTRIEAMVRQGDRKAKAVQAAQQDLYRQLSAAQLGITVASILLGFVAEDTVAFFLRDWFASLPTWLSFLARGGIASVIAISLISFLHVVFGEQAPKALAITHPESVSRWVATPLLIFSWITRPATGLLNSSANWLIRLMGIKDASSELERIHSPEEIRMLVEQSEEGGSLQQQDARLLEGVFEFSEKTAQEVMTPRTQMAALEADLTVEAAADQVAIHGRSRYPAYTESLDDIIGVVHAKDILSALRSRPGQTIRVIMRSPLFVPGTREVEDVLADMKRLKTHLALVLDEYGGTAGLVTMEDLLEEIVGPIYDEHDPQDRSGPDEGGPRLDGSMPISGFNAEYDGTLDDTDYTTIGGYVFGQLGRLPRVGDRVTAGPFTFEVVEMDGRRVKTIRLHIARPEEAGAEDTTAAKPA
ncbi:MAG TPA: hemolysin family protein [Gemmatimonadales bacterium]|jgi:CBS domain containing-hemolysin-like protein|nr:hemolysin family protein [Gemmatimonadales bacterium]